MMCVEHTNYRLRCDWCSCNILDAHNEEQLTQIIRLLAPGADIIVMGHEVWKISDQSVIRYKLE